MNLRTAIDRQPRTEISQSTQRWLHAPSRFAEYLRQGHSTQPERVVPAESSTISPSRREQLFAHTRQLFVKTRPVVEDGIDTSLILVEMLGEGAKEYPGRTLLALLLLYFGATLGLKVVTTNEVEVSEPANSQTQGNPSEATSQTTSSTGDVPAVSEITTTMNGQPANSTLPAETTPSIFYHRVASGDTLTTLAQQYGVTVEAITRANGIFDPNKIYVDQLLEIPVVVEVLAVVESAPGVARVHIVQSGENLTQIAARYGTTVDAIAQANGMANPDWIIAGQQLSIPSY